MENGERLILSLGETCPVHMTRTECDTAIANIGNDLHNSRAVISRLQQYIVSRGLMSAKDDWLAGMLIAQQRGMQDQIEYVSTSDRSPLPIKECQTECEVARDTSQRAIGQCLLNCIDRVGSEACRPPYTCKDLSRLPF